ncbi:DUF3048 domain-containing protein [Herbivorax sp. ANBcel31]|uniref:DUF3048 domain-containing protein n=1 Tax=Herbivorax sp. ANBcel31 TaxID=3069754 RepID=UPI0027ADE377|nr:DUF3048 domain-containing protein [Herbivorax sp. ANBcel31]MDQ2087294.1 DUF3048 domain-containing protein [Herbivorax sp. ANBcel31]
MSNVLLGKKGVLVFLLFLMVLFSFACSREASNPDVIDATPTPLDEELKDENELDEDELEEDDELEERDYALENFEFPTEGTRPYAVMIDNAGSEVLPQGGLHLAQVIYEIIVEGGETRLMPVFWNQEPSMIGPVRSSRHYFLDYSMEHDAIYVHIGWSPMAKSDIPRFGITNINGVAGVFWDITDDPYNWQDSYTSKEKIEDYVERANPRTTTDKEQVFNYSDEAVVLKNGERAEEINLKYSWVMSSSYSYDADKEIYFRFRKDEPHMERVSDKQLTAKNIIIQLVNNYTIKGDNKGRQEVNTVGSGKGYYITNGKYIEITWSKSSRTDKTKYFDEDENEILLNPGQTWVQIFPMNGSVEIE